MNTLLAVDGSDHSYEAFTPSNSLPRRRSSPCFTS